MQQYDLQTLRSFITVVDAGSLVKAAEQLATSTASISRHLSALESSLGSQLLTRTTRRLALTDAGRQFYEDVQNVFQLLDEAEERVRCGREKISGVLRVAAPLSFGVQRIAPILPVFMRRYPDLKVQLLFEDRLTDLQTEGIDIAIRIGNLKDSSLIATRLGSIERVFCASPAYLAAHGEPQSPADFRHHNCLHYSLTTINEEWGIAFADSAEMIDIGGSLSANNAEALREAAIQGIGIVMLPMFVVQRGLQNGQLQRVLPQVALPSYHLSAVKLSRKFTPAKTRLFIDFLRDNLDI